MIVIANVNEMKREIAAMCGALGGLPEGLVFNCKLIASELIANVLKHGGGRAYFSYAREADGVRICVRGERDFRPPDEIPRADVYEENGRGLYLVDALSDSREYSEEAGVRVFLRIRS